MPEISATPSATAITREGDAHLAGAEALQGQREHQATAAVRLAVLDDEAVTEHDEPVGHRRGLLIVGDHDHRLAEVVDGAAQQLEHLGRGLGVEVAGRLVGEDDRRARDERPRDRDALRLAAGELARAGA